MGETEVRLVCCKVGTEVWPGRLPELVVVQPHSLAEFQERGTYLCQARDEEVGTF